MSPETDPRRLADAAPRLKEVGGILSVDRFTWSGGQVRVDSSSCQPPGTVGAGR